MADFRSISLIPTHTRLHRCRRWMWVEINDTQAIGVQSMTTASHHQVCYRLLYVVPGRHLLADGLNTQQWQDLPFSVTRSAHSTWATDATSGARNYTHLCKHTGAASGPAKSSGYHRPCRDIIRVDQGSTELVDEHMASCTLTADNKKSRWNKTLFWTTQSNPVFI